jgi:hypothetical protein
MDWASYLAVRMALWFSAVAVPLFPIVLRDDVDFAWNPTKFLYDVNQAGAFRDLMFVIVPVAVLSLSTSVDFFCRTFSQMTGRAASLTALAFIGNTVALISGFVGFMRIPNGVILGSISSYSVFIVFALVFSIGTEIVVSRYHR